MKFSISKGFGNPASTIMERGSEMESDSSNFDEIDDVIFDEEEPFDPLQEVIYILIDS